ncbi:MAG: hypothetical protein DI587_35520 [Variovorax paradoxus]|nr:MAG: hypothetical protein DI583_35520 [Variovorax paradoxus]PZQ01160.1 MAG: hypothetical protein DI587_35520 [Variovorax paradoxus]
MNKLAHGLAPALVLCLPLGVLAQSASSQAEDSNAPAPALLYQSAFSDYKPWQDLKPGNWRQLNDALVATPAGKTGGHAGHAMPSASGGTAAPAPSTPLATPHGGHPKHGGKP